MAPGRHGAEAVAESPHLICKFRQPVFFLFGDCFPNAVRLASNVESSYLSSPNASIAAVHHSHYLSLLCVQRTTFERAVFSHVYLGFRSQTQVTGLVW